MQYRTIPFMGGYDASLPGDSFLGSAGAIAAPVKVILQADNSKLPGWPGFFSWLAENHPSLYGQMRVRFTNLALFNPPVTNGIQGLGADPTITTDLGPIVSDIPTINVTTPSLTDQIVGAITSLAPTVLATVDQQKIFNAQLNRAQNGLPPLNTSSYGLPSMQGAVNTLMTPILIIGGLGLGFLLLRKRR